MEALSKPSRCAAVCSVPALDGRQLSTDSGVSELSDVCVVQEAFGTWQGLRSLSRWHWCLPSTVVVFSLQKWHVNFKSDRAHAGSRCWQHAAATHLRSASFPTMVKPKKLAALDDGVRLGEAHSGSCFATWLVNLTASGWMFAEMSFFCCTRAPAAIAYYSWQCWCMRCSCRTQTACLPKARSSSVRFKSIVGSRMCAAVCRKAQHQLRSAHVTWERGSKLTSCAAQLQQQVYGTALP